MNHILLLMQQGEDVNPLTSFLPLILIVVVFYFFMIRPQMKRQKETRAFRESLAKGDKVVTTGGIYGKVTDIKDNVIILQVDKEVSLKVDKSAVIKDITDAPQQK